MTKNLVIVESPAKAKTIAGVLGSDFRVESSFGHIRDLPKKDIGVDIKNGFKPDYQISEDKAKTVASLKKAAHGKELWLASDGDREGEAIAWHVCTALGFKPEKAKRIVFHEITKPAIEAAVSKPRTIDMKLVEAQQARRILDRLVGYELSPVLWRKVRTGLSAGRVQSVAVRLIVEREREIKAFKSTSSFKITAIFSDGSGFSADYALKADSDKTARQILDSVAKAKFKVETVEQKPGTRSPSPPFTTSTLQQEAGRRLGYSVRQTMTLAQRLYEAGHISYMRTDSTNLSPLAVSAANKYITKEFGADYARETFYKTKSKSAQEAHEAIRPTHLNKPKAGADTQQIKLYELIWKRTIASQMAPARVKKTEVKISASNLPELFIAVGEVLDFDGFLKVWGGGKEDKLLPELSVGQGLKLKSASAEQVYSRAPGRYSEPSLVKKLEELGIGRPSTYAPTISTIQDREYVEKKDIDGESKDLLLLKLENGKIKESTSQTMVGADSNKLAPTGLADIVTDFLVKYFADIVDYDFTARAENELDDIADGSLAWNDMLAKFYKKFHPLVEKSADATREEVSQARKLGKDPKTGLPVIARYGRYGPMLQLGEADKDKKDDEESKPRFSSLPEGTELDTITLAQALPMFELPRAVGKTKEGEEITADIGRYGPYVKVGKTFYSIKDHDPFKITHKQALAVIAAKEKADAEKLIADYGKLQILNGPYGPYITDGKRNARVPKDQDPAKLNEKSAQKLLDEAPARRGRWKSSKKTASS